MSNLNTAWFIGPTLILAVVGCPDSSSESGSGGGQGGGGLPTAPMVAFAVSASEVAEADGTFDVSVRLSIQGSTQAALTVPIDVLASSTATAAGDYDIDAETVTFPGGSSDGAEQLVSLTLDSDALVEGSETVVLQLGTPDGGATLGEMATHTVTIRDSDSASVSFETAPMTPEIDGAATVDVVLAAGGPSGDAVLADALTVDVSDAATGTASAGADYVAPPTTTITFEAGAGNGDSQGLPLTILADLQGEPDETVDLLLTDPSAPLQIGDGMTSLSIHDDDRLLTGSTQGGAFLNGQDISSTLASTTNLGIRGLAYVEGLAFDAANNRVFLSSGYVDGVAMYDVPSKALTYLGGYGLGDANMLGLAYDPNTMTLYGTDTYSETLFQIDTQTGVASSVGMGGNLAAAVRGLAFDPNANVLYGSTGGQLITIDTAAGTGTWIGSFGSGLVVNGLAFDPATGTLYGVYEAAGSDVIAVIDPSTGVAVAVTAIQGFNALVRALAFDTVNDRLYVEDLASSRSALLGVDPSNGTATIESYIARGDARAVAHDSVAGVSYIVTGEVLFSVDKATGVATHIGLINYNFPNIDALAVDPLGPTLYAETNGTLITLSATDASIVSTSYVIRAGTSSFVGLTGLAWDSSSQTLWGVDNNELFTIDPTSGEATAIGPPNLGGLQSLAIDPVTTTLYAVRSASWGETLVTLDPATGALTTIGYTGSAMLSGFGFDTATGELYGIDNERDSWVRIPPSTGLMHTVDSFGIEARGMAWDRNTQTLYAVDGAQDFLFSVDPATGTAHALGRIGYLTETLAVEALAFDPATNVLYAAVANTNNLVELSTSDGSLSGLVGALDIPIVGLALDATTNILYGTDGSTLYIIDTSTAAATTVGAHGAFSSMAGLAFDSEHGLLYGVDSVAHAIAAIDTSTGAAQFVRATSHRDNHAIVLAD